jgi:hypothetical protein
VAWRFAVVRSRPVLRGAPDFSLSFSMEGEGVWSYGDYTAELHRLAQQCEHVLMDITEGRVATDLDLEGAFKSVDQGLDWMLHTLQECHLYLQRHQFSDAHYDVYDYYHREYKQLDYS